MVCLELFDRVLHLIETVFIYIMLLILGAIALNLFYIILKGIWIYLVIFIVVLAVGSMFFGREDVD